VEGRRTISKSKALGDRQERLHTKEDRAFFHFFRNDAATSAGDNSIDFSKNLSYRDDRKT
jgi:hypothetical protein